eukprot:scaffold5101_cov403-Prasinococcus_capsulatus_cf.AAC.6
MSRLRDLEAQRQEEEQKQQQLQNAARLQDLEERCADRCSRGQASEVGKQLFTWWAMLRVPLAAAEARNDELEQLLHQRQDECRETQASLMATQEKLATSESLARASTERAAQLERAVAGERLAAEAMKEDLRRCSQELKGAADRAAASHKRNAALEGRRRLIVVADGLRRFTSSVSPPTE